MPSSQSPVLVVGATGLLGSDICRRARAAGHAVRALVRHDSAGRAALADIGCELVEGDLADAASLASACRGIGTVVTTANAILPRRRGDTMAAVDRDGTLALVAAARQAGVRRFIYTSVGPQLPSTVPFVRYKREVEAAVRASGMAWLILQPAAFMEIHTGPLGGWDLRRARARIAGRGRAPVGYVSLHDVAAVTAAALSRDDIAGDLPVTGPEPLSASAALAIAERIAGRRFAVQRMPIAVMKAVRTLIGPFNPGLGSLFGLIVAQDAIAEPPPATPFAHLGVTPTTFAEYVERGLGTPRD